MTRGTGWNGRWTQESWGGCLPFWPWLARACRGRSARARPRGTLPRRQALLRGSWKEPAPSGHWAPPASKGRGSECFHPTTSTPKEAGTHFCPFQSWRGRGNSHPRPLGRLRAHTIPHPLPRLVFAGAGSSLGWASRHNLHSKIHLHRSHQRQWWCPQCRRSARPAGEEQGQAKIRDRPFFINRESIQISPHSFMLRHWWNQTDLWQPNLLFFPWGFFLSLLSPAPVPLCVDTHRAPCDQQPRHSGLEEPAQALRLWTAASKGP